MIYDSSSEWEKIEDAYFNLVKDFTILVGTVFGSSIALAAGRNVNASFILGEFFLFIALVAGIINLYATLKGKEFFHFLMVISELEQNKHRKVDEKEDFLLKANEDLIEDYERLKEKNQKGPLTFVLRIIKIDYFYPLLLFSSLLGIFFIFISLFTFPSLSFSLKLPDFSSAILSFMNPALSPWIESLGAVGTIGAAIAAWFAINLSNKRLKIEQTPYIVLDHIKRIDERLDYRFGFAVKNIGRGPAINITFSVNKDFSRRNDAFFSDDQPHSANFTSMEVSYYWEVDANRLDNLIFKRGFAFLYIFFEDQASSLFRTKVKVKKIGTASTLKYIVMENQFEGRVRT